MYDIQDCIAKILTLEHDVKSWKSRFETEALWRKVVQAWLLQEFGFDVTEKLQALKRSNRLLDVPFKRKGSAVQFIRIKTEAAEIPQTSEEISANDILSCLPETIEVSEVPPSPTTSDRQTDLIIEPTEIPADESDESKDVEDYNLEYDEVNGDDYDERTEYPLTIYDDDDDIIMDTDTPGEDSHSGKEEGMDGFSPYKSDHLEFTVVEPADVDEDKSVNVQSYSESLGVAVRPNKSLIQTVYFDGQKRKFQCRACNRMFNDRGNGHRHVRRMHPGSSLAEQRKAEMDSYLIDPPILEPEISLTEGPELTDVDIQALVQSEEEKEEEDEDEFEDEKEMYQNAAAQLASEESHISHNNGVGKLSVEERNAAAQLIRKLDENRYQCLQCSRLFSIGCNARRHVRVVHFGEKLYACQICKKLFSSKTDGIIHEKTCMGRKITKIEGDPPSFQCTICENRYPDVQSAWHHARKMHLAESDKPHKCAHCPRSYFNRKDLLRHSDKCRGGEDPGHMIICKTENSSQNVRGKSLSDLQQRSQAKAAIITLSGVTVDVIEKDEDCDEDDGDSHS